MAQVISLTIVLAAVWFVWSGIFTSFILTLGALSVLAVILFVWRLGLFGHDGIRPYLPLTGMGYGLWLLKEIALSNIDVARRILDPRLPIDPRIIRVRPSQRSDLGRMIYANSITLTPGTVSLDLDDDEIEVHALTKEAAESLQSGAMDRRVTGIRGID